ncbi:oligosaccharide flippase family protein [Paraburkholderia sp.]|uniref:lipopolysaccharide biosynthesis protein n=1 Tax=Paraburkholderia sp. TaxID=1926495 RepID=UPI0023837FA8|nr:oligosaccharide flippase family protein [Paraburkholderia sp.]MDE1180422.1 oligosaccharide flippase family protein [Paraburkholderia sp.]
MIRVKDSVVSMAGVVTGQIALFLCISLIGRLRGPEALGQFNYLLALGTFAGTLLAFRFELACVTDSPRQSFSALANVMALSSAVMIVAVVATSASGHADLYAVEAYAFACFIQQATGSYLNSLRRYGWIAASRVVVNGSFLVSLVVANLNHAIGLVDVFETYTIVNCAVSAVMLVAVVVHGRRHDYPFNLSRHFFFENARFAKYILPSTLCGSVLTYSLAIIIPRWFDAESAGYFAAAYRLGFFPVSLIGQSLGGVFRRDAIGAIARDDADTALPKVFVAYAKSLAILGLFYAVCGGLLFAPLVQIFFGGRWHGASTFFYDLIPLFAFQMIYVPLSQIFLATREQRIDFAFQLTCGVVLIGVLSAAKAMNLSVQSSVQMFSLAGAALMILGVTLTYRVMSVNAIRLRAVA